MSQDNPYQSPRAADSTDQTPLNETVRDILALKREDICAYAWCALLAGGCIAPETWMVATAFIASTLCLVMYLVTSAPKYAERSNLHQGVKAFGRVSNGLMAMIHVVVISGRVFYLLVGKAGPLAFLSNSAPFG